MRNRLVMGAITLMAIVVFSPRVRAQAKAGAGAAKPAAKAKSTAPKTQDAATTQPQSTAGVPNLGGNWVRDGKGGGFGSSLSLSDPGGKKRGNEDDIPYQPWAREKTLAQVTNTGPDAQFGKSTNPQMWCEPVGSPAVYGWPAKTKLVQTPEAVYILYEYGVRYRIVWLNSKHPKDPDPQWWGHSIGWYENGDTLVVDTVGLNDKVWLDEAAHPQTEKMHMVERYKRVDKDRMRLDITLDDPGAYTKPWTTFKYFKTVDTGFLQYQWECTVREVQGFFDTVGKPASPDGSSK